jgi:hypothetical protein
MGVWVSTMEQEDLEGVRVTEECVEGLEPGIRPFRALKTEWLVIID